MSDTKHELSDAEKVFDTGQSQPPHLLPSHSHLYIERYDLAINPDFDDPNIDKEAAIQGVLGTPIFFLSFLLPISTSLCRG